MIPETMLELIILDKICRDYWEDNTYATYLDNHYNMQKLGDRYSELGKEFLSDYALNKTEKSD